MEVEQKQQHERDQKRQSKMQEIQQEEQQLNKHKQVKPQENMIALWIGSAIITKARDVKVLEWASYCIIRVCNERPM